MAGVPNLTSPTTHPPQWAGVKRTRTQERQPPRKSARLEKLRQGDLIPVDNSSETTCDSPVGSVCAGKNYTEQRQTPISQRLPGQDQSSPELLSDSGRKRRRRSAQENSSVPARPDRPSGDNEHPVSYWAANKRWPPNYSEEYFGQGNDMENLLARKRSVSASSRKKSDTESSTPTSTDPGGPKSREQKSAEYKKPQYETVLATKGVFMKASLKGVNDSSRKWCKDLLVSEQEFPRDTLFRDDLFDSTCAAIQGRNETRVIRDIALLIVPSAETLAIRGATDLECLIDSVNEGWNNSFPITKTRPQPDYAVGFRREAFTQDQLDRMHPVIGDFNNQSYFMATWYMYLPFLTCEVKCGAGSLDIADRQNAHSAAIAVRAVVELFRIVKRDKELHREILAFSISHDHQLVHIYGHYAEIDDSGTKYYRRTIRRFSFLDLDGTEKWTAYRFTKNVYQKWMPKHFKRICSAIDQIPANISFAMSQSGPAYSEQPSGLSQDFDAHSIAQSSSASAQAEDSTRSSIGHKPVATPGTSLADREIKKPRVENAPRGGK